MVETKQAATERAHIESRVLRLIRELLSELGSERALRSLSLQASLERDLGIGSLERLELLQRLEKEFSLRLTDRVMTEADSPIELINAILQRDFTPAENFSPALSSSLNEPLSAGFDLGSISTLNEAFQRYALLEPRRPQIHLLQADDEAHIIRYGQLFEAASAVAAGLLENGLNRGETVAVMLPTGEEFFAAFFGILLAGGVAVPIYPPFRPDRLEEYSERQCLILRNAEIRALITFQKVEVLLRLLRPRVPSLTTITTVRSLSKGPARTVAEPSGEEPALIQYTSGSTGNPKGVVLTHANLLANIRGIGQAVNVRPTDVGVSWLPLYHDMGLIGSWLFCVYFGIPITILSPLDFLNRPERWLWAIHHYRGTLSAAPNFAYELCANKIAAKALQGLDLSCWRAAFNGAEPVSRETLNHFTQRFAPYGFRPEALLPVYGLAESSVALTVSSPGRVPQVDWVDRRSFQVERKAVPASSSGCSTLGFVSVGQPLPAHEVRVVDDEGFPVSERIQGNIQFRGPSTMMGYFKNPEATEKAFRQDWVDTGDLGYLAERELFVTSRRKDMIIKGGRNLYPQEIEEIAGKVAGVRRGCVAAFGINDPKTGTERLVVVAETRETDSVARDQLATEIGARVDAAIGIPPDSIELASPQVVPKTSSGKIRRDACKGLYLSGRLSQKRLPAWLQLARILASSSQEWIRLGLARLIRAVYGFYVWVIFALLVLPAWPVIMLVPSSPQFQKPNRILRFLCRIWLRLAGLRPDLEGDHHLVELRSACTRDEPLLLVSNHASYIDPIVLSATMPFDIRFVAKREASSWPVIGTFIRKCGALTVNRTDPSCASQNTEKIALLLQEGAVVHIFPEGTFTAQAGVRPFQMGAFKAAVETGSCVVPIALSGTRKVLPDGSWLPRWGGIRVAVGPSLRPQAKTWQEMVRIRDAARAEVSKKSGEGSLNLVRAGLPRGEGTQ